MEIPLQIKFQPLLETRLVLLHSNWDQAQRLQGHFQSEKVFQEQKSCSSLKWCVTESS